MPEPAQFSWKDARILIADDEPDMRDIFGSWLRNLGSSVTTVADGKEALEALARERFDAVVTDVRMPRVDGIELVHMLYRSGRYTPVVIFVSGFVDLPLPDAYDLGVEAVLAKPCERKELVAALKRSILRRHMVFEPEEAVSAPAPQEVIRQSFVGELEVSPVAIGRGGMSLETAGYREPGSPVAFSLTFSEGLLRVVSGWGLLKWFEVLSGKPRAGIEFMQLDPETREAFAEWVDERHPASFIPKLPCARDAASAAP